MPKTVSAYARPYTLAFDIGGTGLKASVLDKSGVMVADRVRTPTRYPCSPGDLVDTLARLASSLPDFDRISAGFPGVVRNGVCITAPHFVRIAGPGSAISDDLLKQWTRFDLAKALADRLGKPAKVINDADLQGADVISGEGVELVVTLGTGVGTGLFQDGRLAPHLELAQHPFRKGQTYNEQLGEKARERIGDKKWNKRVRKAIQTLYTLVVYDRLYIGGGNAHHLEGNLGDNIVVVDNSAGILGGIKLWDDPKLGI
ncbi:MAG: ROK family protein [Actinobacteria bacterium]|nr:ROK family protein [Actinomycetota bacterium]MCL6095725.1 ROK family protein [Actinomycetota bacterium]